MSDFQQPQPQPQPQQAQAQAQPPVAEQMAQPVQMDKEQQYQQPMPVQQSVQSQASGRRGLDFKLLLPLAAIAVCDFIVLVTTAIRVHAYSDSFRDNFFLNFGQVKYLLAVSVIAIPVIAYLTLHGVTGKLADKWSVFPLALSALMALLFLVGGALVARLASIRFFCNIGYLYDDCAGWTSAAHAEISVAAVFAFFAFALWVGLMVLNGLRAFKTMRANNRQTGPVTSGVPVGQV